MYPQGCSVVHVTNSPLICLHNKAYNGNKGHHATKSAGDLTKSAGNLTK